MSAQYPVRGPVLELAQRQGIGYRHPYIPRFKLNKPGVLIANEIEGEKPQGTVREERKIALGPSPRHGSRPHHGIYRKDLLNGSTLLHDKTVAFPGIHPGNNHGILKDNGVSVEFPYYGYFLR